MQIFNTMSRKKETFVPLIPGRVSIYSCGPTVYNYFHLGNARPFITFDTLRRYFEYQGYQVDFVQNFTDIDDKMINKANAEGTTVKELADQFIKEYYVDAKGLNIKEATHHPRATESMVEIVRLIETLVEKGYAYTADDGVYYSVRKFPDYCGLSHFDIDELVQNSRKDVLVDSGKQDPVDFALWKFRKENEPFWPSPWGEGRPGWHIECSAMSKKYLGESIDIHSGGQDLIFPHHENEIAQSEAASGKQFVRYWMHNGFINVNGEKMSKSEGNFFLVRDVANKFGYMPIRLFMLSSHYRTPINYTPDLLNAAASGFARIQTAMKTLNFVLASPLEPSNAEAAAAQKASLEEACRLAVEHFEAAMDDDLNTADALGSIFELVRIANTESAAPLSQEGLVLAKDTLERLCEVMGFSFVEEGAIPQEVLDLAEARQVAKKERNFALADSLRTEIQQRGYRITDTPQGPHIEAEA